MFNLKQYNLKNYNFSLLVIITILGVISTFSIKLSGLSYYNRQIFGYLLGFILIAIFSLIDYHEICRFAAGYYVVVSIMLALVKFSPLGTDLGTGATRWIDLKVVDLQPSELAKLGLILMLAVLLVKLEDEMERYRSLLIVAAVTFVPTILIFAQPDLSSSMVMVFIMVIMTFAGGLSYKIVSRVIIIGTPLLAGIFWYIMQPGQNLLDPYQVKRIIGFLSPNEYQMDINFQQLKSIKGIGTGQLYGKLLSDGADTVRGYSTLPVNESDFIWSVIGEEFGFLGGCLILFLLVLVVIFCLRTASRAKDQLGRMLAFGISALFMFQTFANIGVATMILPNTGLPLPFVSYGLSSLMTYMIAIGIILNIRLQQSNVRG